MTTSLSLSRVNSPFPRLPPRSSSYFHGETKLTLLLSNYSQHFTTAAASVVETAHEVVSP